MSIKPAVYPWPFLAALYVGSALNPVNSSLLAAALVPIAGGLHIAVGQTVVLVTSLSLASAVAQPTAGKLAEEFGARRIFFFGIVLVFIGGLSGGVGNNLATLVVARVLIGVGTSAGYPCAMLLTRKPAEDTHLERPPGAVLGGLQVAAMVLANRAASTPLAAVPRSGG